MVPLGTISAHHFAIGLALPISKTDGHKKPFGLGGAMSMQSLAKANMVIVALGLFLSHILEVLSLFSPHPSAPTILKEK